MSANKKRLISPLFQISEKPLSLNQLANLEQLRQQVSGLIVRCADLIQDHRVSQRKDEDRRKKLYLSILDVMDAFDRIFRELDMAALDEQARDLVSSFHLTRVLLENILSDEDVVAMEGLEGSRFDHRTQEVIGVEERADLPEGTILEVRERGYLWSGKLLRRARVICAKESKTA